MAITVSIGMLSTFPPTQCGLATFSQALTKYVREAGAEVGVIRVVDAPDVIVPPVVHHLDRSNPDGPQGAARALNSFDVAIIQHEYGIFGGRDGEDVLDVLAHMKVPVIVVMHTVLAEPSAHQYEVLARVAAAAALMVTMTETARERLVKQWAIDPSRVLVIPHGAEDDRVHVVATDPEQVPTFLTWGLLGPGKGVEWALHGLASIKDVVPAPVYKVVGQTHPRVIEREGQKYRSHLEQLVATLGLQERALFDDRYLDGDSLRATVHSADVVVLPYDSLDQVTSGVLTEAVVAGKPVISTSFPHARELLSGGAGILVPQRDPHAIGLAMRRILAEPGLAQSMAQKAQALAPSLLWPAVAQQYIKACSALGASAARSVA